MKPSSMPFPLLSIAATLSAVALAAVPCPELGAGCILSTEGWDPAAASYILSLDYSSGGGGSTLLYDPFQHIQSSLGAADPTIRGPAYYSLALASLASYVPTDNGERSAWETALLGALSRQAAAATATTVTTVTTVTTTTGQSATTGGQTTVQTATQTPAQTAGMTTQAGSATVSSSVSHAAAAPSPKPTGIQLMAVAGAIAGAAGIAFGR